MPTIGQLKFLLSRLERDLFRARLDRADFWRLFFVRESRAPRLGVRFAAMAAFYVNCGLPMTQASIAA
jgi:hypothetical protein